MRRPLHTVELHPPDFKVPTCNSLIDDYIEKEVKYVATIPLVPFSIDPRRRTEILRTLDNIKERNVEFSNTKSSLDGILSFSAKEIKLLKREPEELILREVVHNIAAVSYIHDSNKHLIFIKTANGEMKQQEYCKLIVCECASKEKADEICSIIQQIFNVVYTQLTMKRLDRILAQISSGSSSSDPRQPYDGAYPMQPPGSPESSVIYLLKEYIETIKLKLSEEELQQFGQILGDYRLNNDISTFCSKLYGLYGVERKTLIPGMRPYIPERDIKYFDTFLESHNLQTAFWPASRRTPSDTSSSSTLGQLEIGAFTHSEIDETQDIIDQSLQEHAETVNQLERSIES